MDLLTTAETLGIDLLVNPADEYYSDNLWSIVLSPIGSKFGVIADSIEAALEILGAYCDDNAKGYIVDASVMSDEELEEASLFHVNGALDCSLDLSECMKYMVTSRHFEPSKDMDECNEVGTFSIVRTRTMAWQNMGVAK
jgi:hypothetical protein